ncbi:MAG TPA: DedA family protein [Nitrososphaerales archaeon]|nr:DedA family protein [Nitrososphaerales archaeon]
MQPQKVSFVPMSRVLLLVSLVTFIVGFLEATDVIQLPIGGWLTGISGSILSSQTLSGFMSQYGYASVFALMALESASLPIPSEVVLPLAGYFVRLGVLDFWLAVLVSTAASLFGALVDYFLAKWLGRPFVVGLLNLFRIHRDVLDRAEGWFTRSAQWTVFIARFIPGLRTAISLPAGLFEMSLVRFVVMTVAGCFAWSVILIYAGVLAGSAAGGNLVSSPEVVDGISAIFAAVAAAYIGFFAYSKYKGAGSSSTHPA